MKSLLFGALAVVALCGLAALPASAAVMPGKGLTASQDHSAFQAVANRRTPYRNVNRGNDAGNNTGDAAVEALNQQSLARAQAGQNSPTQGPDSTSNLNDMSERNAARGRNMGRTAPMPFR